MENLDNLNEDEILALEVKIKRERLPNYRIWALVPYNVAVGLGVYYFYKNYKRLVGKYF